MRNDLGCVNHLHYLLCNKILCDVLQLGLEPRIQPVSYTHLDVYKRQVPLLAMHDMIERMMAGQMSDPQQLQAWAAKQ